MTPVGAYDVPVLVAVAALSVALLLAALGWRASAYRRSGRGCARGATGLPDIPPAASTPAPRPTVTATAP